MSNRAVVMLVTTAAESVLECAWVTSGWGSPQHINEADKYLCTLGLERFGVLLPEAKCGEWTIWAWPSSVCRAREISSHLPLPSSHPESLLSATCVPWILCQLLLFPLQNQSFPCQGSPVSCLRRFSHLLDSLEEDEKHLSQRPKGKVAEDWSGEKTGRAIWGVTLVELYQSMGSTLGLWKHETNRWGLYLTLPVCPITCPRGFTTMILCGNLTPYSLGSEISYQCPDTLPMKMVVSHGLAFSEITHRNYYFHSKLYYCLPSAGFAFRLLFFFFPSFLTGKVRLFIWDLSSLFKLVL